MRRSRAARRARRAAGRLRLGGEAGRGLAGGVEEGEAPGEGDEGEVVVQARPGPPLVVAEPELLLAVLMEPFDGPAPVGQAEQVPEGPGIEGPGEVPLRFAVVPGQGALADQPAERAGRVAVGAVGAQAAGLPLGPLLLPIADGDGQPLAVRHARRQLLGGVQRRDPEGMGARARATATGRLRQGVGRRLHDLVREPRAERLGDLDDVWLAAVLQAGQEGRHVAVPRVAVTTPCATRAARARSTKSSASAGLVANAAAGTRAAAPASACSRKWPRLGGWAT